MGRVDMAMQDLFTIITYDSKCKKAIELFEKLGPPSTNLKDYLANYPGYDAIPKQVDTLAHRKYEKPRANCWFHNHKHCRNGDKCKLSHSVDEKGVRDDRGKSVCLSHLTETCPSGNKCNYSHNLSHLSDHSRISALIQNEIKNEREPHLKALEMQKNLDKLPTVEYHHPDDSDDSDNDDFEDDGSVVFEPGPDDQVLRTLTCHTPSCTHYRKPNQPRPLALILSLGHTHSTYNQSYATEIRFLHEHTAMAQVFALDAAWKVLSTSSPTCVYVTDEGTTLPPPPSFFFA